jgi:radical SAM superfamily enzyme YgiQ (UPF0313 family)
MTQQAMRAYEIAEMFRARASKVILGGIHATVLPDEARLHADSVIVGEAENTWGELLDDFAQNRLKPVYKSTNEVDLAKLFTKKTGCTYKRSPSYGCWLHLERSTGK